MKKYICETVKLTTRSDIVKFARRFCNRNLRLWVEPQDLKELLDKYKEWKIVRFIGHIPDWNRECKELLRPCKVSLVTIKIGSGIDEEAVEDIYAELSGVFPYRCYVYRAVVCDPELDLKEYMIEIACPEKEKLSDFTDENEEKSEELSDIIQLTDEEGNESQFELLDLVQFNGNEYVVLLPLEEPDDGAEVVILMVEPTDNEDEDSYVSVENEETLMNVFEIFKEKHKDQFNFVD